MKKASSIAALLLLASTSFAFAATTSVTATATSSMLPLKGAELLPQAKLTLAQARAKALKAEHGIITEQELENEKGSLRFSFDVKVGMDVHEVGVDAKTGKILEDKIDKG